VALSHRIRPAEISWLVVAIVVNAVQRVTWRAWSERVFQVCYEYCDVVPLIAKTDATSAIVIVVMILRVITPGADIVPPRIVRVIGEAMSGLTLPNARGVLSLEASAGACDSLYEVVDPCVHEVPAPANAMGFADFCALRPNLGSLSHEREASEMLARTD
jgi:hypothetical protein